MHWNNFMNKADEHNHAVAYHNHTKKHVESYQMTSLNTVTAKHHNNYIYSTTSISNPTNSAQAAGFWLRDFPEEKIIDMTINSTESSSLPPWRNADHTI